MMTPHQPKKFNFSKWNLGYTLKGLIAIKFHESLGRA